MVKIVLKFVIYLMLLSTCTFPTRSEIENGFKDMQIFPGTKWCGVGNIAATNQSDIGIYQRTDLCCRAHDKCPIKLRPFKHGFGLFNARPHTVSHCVCDEAFKSCLKMDGSNKSRLIGQFYFSQLSAPCFTLKKGQRCLKRTWWGKCTESDEEKIVGVWHSTPKYR